MRQTRRDKRRAKRRNRIVPRMPALGIGRNLLAKMNQMEENDEEEI